MKIETINCIRIKSDDLNINFTKSNIHAMTTNEIGGMAKSINIEFYNGDLGIINLNINSHNLKQSNTLTELVNNLAKIYK